MSEFDCCSSTESWPVFISIRVWRFSDLSVKRLCQVRRVLKATTLRHCCKYFTLSTFNWILSYMRTSGFILVILRYLLIESALSLSSTCLSLFYCNSSCTYLDCRSLKDSLSWDIETLDICWISFCDCVDFWDPLKDELTESFPAD